MTLEEVPLVIEYFHAATPEYLEALGVDPTRLPARTDWLGRYRAEHDRPIEQRQTMLVIWSDKDGPIGFSSADKIVFGDRANMHLHIFDSKRRNAGVGAQCVMLTAEFYFERLRIKRLLCEPNAFNIAPNRALQKAGFRYEKTYRTVPGSLGYHQAVTRWVLDGRAARSANNVPSLGHSPRTIAAGVAHARLPGSATKFQEEGPA